MKKLISTLLIAGQIFAQSVTTAGYSNRRTNANLAETKLTQANVGRLAYLGAYATDGAVYAQPLVAENVQGRNLVIIATMHSSVYAFDRDRPGSSYIWRMNLSSSLATAGPGGSWPNGEIGCEATPVIDMAKLVVYANCVDVNNDWYIYSLNLADGSVYHAPFKVTGSSSGVTFNSTHQQNGRAGLMLFNGILYVAFASLDDFPPYNGWMFGYDSTTLALTYTWCNTCASGANGGAGIWWSPASDGTNIYVVTGNGDWDGVNNFGESFVKLSPSLTVLDYMTPANWATLNVGDQDLGVSRPILIEGNSYVISQSKDSRLWVASTSALGGLQGRDAGPAQVWTPTEPARFNDIAYANHKWYVGGTFFLAYDWLGGSFNTSWTSGGFGTQFGGGMSYSSNNDNTGTAILWVTTCVSSAFGQLRPGVLHALNGDTMVELWNSGTTLGNLAKFGAPTVTSGGYVYAGTQSNTVAIYGFPPDSAMSGSVVIGGRTALK